MVAEHATTTRRPARIAKPAPVSPGDPPEPGVPPETGDPQKPGVPPEPGDDPPGAPPRRMSALAFVAKYSSFAAIRADDAASLLFCEGLLAASCAAVKWVAPILRMAASMDAFPTGIYGG